MDSPERYQRSPRDWDAVYPEFPTQHWNLDISGYSPTASEIWGPDSSECSPAPPASPPASPAPPPSPAPSPPPEIISENEEIMIFIVSNLEEDTAFLENDLYTLKYTLGALKSCEFTPDSMQRKALQIVGEIGNIDHDILDLQERHTSIDFGVNTLDLNDITQELKKQLVMVDKTLVAAGEMSTELREWADTIYFEANELANLMEDSDAMMRAQGLPIFKPQPDASLGEFM